MILKGIVGFYLWGYGCAYIEHAKTKDKGWQKAFGMIGGYLVSGLGLNLLMEKVLGINEGSALAITTIWIACSRIFGNFTKNKNNNKLLSFLRWPYDKTLQLFG